jgi:AraC-like DNA-binding protein
VTGTVSAKTVRAALGGARALGVDASALAARWGVAEALTNVDARFAHSAWLGLWQDIIQQTGKESVGLEAAERLPWGHWDVIDYLTGTSENLGGALRRFERYFAVISTGVAHVLERHEHQVHLVRRYAPDCYTRLLAPAEFAFASVVIRMRMALGFRWCPEEVRFAAPAPQSQAAWRQFFGCPVRFDVEPSAIVIESSALELPMQSPDPELRSILERHAEMLVGQLGTETDLVSRTRRGILDGLRDADVSVARTARRLGMSVRTLQRRLQDGGQTFDELVDATRSELARRYLGDPTLSIQETAHLLAFGDLRGFYRAFRRWEDCTPAEYRQRVRPEARGVGASGP